jgi:hypothetical protein
MIESMFAPSALSAPSLSTRTSSTGTSISSEPPTKVPAPASPSPHVINDEKRPALNANQVEKFLNRFESRFAYFPFVVLPPAWTVMSMLQRHPFLVLGILSAMSAEDAILHRRLDCEFRRVLGEKVTMNGEKSLDILQGLLVHIAWWVPFPLPLQSFSFPGY